MIGAEEESILPTDTCDDVCAGLQRLIDANYVASKEEIEAIDAVLLKYA